MMFSQGIAYCSNPKLGQFDVTLSRDKNQPGLYALQINTLQLAQYGGNYVRIAIANEDLKFEELALNTLATPGAPLYEGYLTAVQLQKFDLLVIAPFRGQNSSILSSVSQGDEAICDLPTTDNTTVNSGVPGKAI